MNRANPSKRFGTFGGVFTPNVLCILGVIAFLRTGWVVGNAGLIGALAIIVIANVITFCTALSLSAIATNMRVRGGGAYYLISRSLGLEIGGSIGIPLCLSQAGSVAFYIVGFTESIHAFFPAASPRAVSTLVCVVLAMISMIGADLAIRVQYVIMATLVLAFGSFFLGRGATPDVVALWPQYIHGQDFWSVFAVFFPAVTGIMAGASMSGDLKDPKTNIPRGTLMAIGLTFVVYVWLAAWLAWNAPRDRLVGDTFIMHGIARSPWLIYAGVWAATLSSGLASLVAAPRTMQALARDHILPRFLRRGSGPSGEPRVATLITFAIAELCILIGDLNAIAPVITMFFLTTYGVTNLSAGIERLIRNPSYRPGFQVHWLVSLAAACGCVYAMVLISPTATVCAAAAVVAIHVILRRQRLRVTWGDVRSGAWFSIARFALLKVQEYREHPKNWRPNVIVFSGNPRMRRFLVDFANWLGQGMGIVTLCHLIIQSDKGDARAKVAAAERQINTFIRNNGLEAFGLVRVAEELHVGITDIVRYHGLAGQEPNVVLLGWPGESRQVVRYVSAIREGVRLGRNMLMLKVNPEKPFGKRRKIDIWWGGLQNNGPFMLLVAHLLRQNSEWAEAEARVLMAIESEAGHQKAQKNMQNLFEEARIEADAEIIVTNLHSSPIHEVIAQHSAEADLVILGTDIPKEGAERNYMQRMHAFLADLPNALLVRSAAEMDIFA